jgi:hypothetical protein
MLHYFCLHSAGFRPVLKLIRKSGTKKLQRQLQVRALLPKSRFSFLANISTDFHSLRTFSTDVFTLRAVGHAVHQRDVQETASLNNYSVKQDVFTHCQALRPVYVRWEYNDAKMKKSLGTDQNSCLQ